MTVTDLFPGDGKEMARCSWFSGGKLQQGAFPVSSLVKSKPRGLGAIVVG